jgi:hypothetical protein
MQRVAVLHFLVFVRQRAESTILDQTPKLLSRASVLVREGVTTWKDVMSLLSPQLPEATEIIGFNNPGSFYRSGEVDLIPLSLLGRALLGKDRDATPYEAATSVGAIREYTVMIEPSEYLEYEPNDYLFIKLHPNAVEMPKTYTPTLVMNRYNDAREIWSRLNRLVPSISTLRIKDYIGLEHTFRKGETIPFITLENGKPAEPGYSRLQAIAEVHSGMPVAGAGAGVGTPSAYGGVFAGFGGRQTWARSKSRSRVRTLSRGGRSGSRRRSRSRGSRARVRRN